MSTSNETPWEKFQRKLIQEPLVPFGALVTVGFLGYGLKAFHRGETKNAQMLMRGRVLAQGFTVIAMAVGAYYGVKPHDRPATYEEKLKQLQNNTNK